MTISLYLCSSMASVIRPAPPRTNTIVWMLPWMKNTSGESGISSFADLVSLPQYSDPFRK